MDCCLNPNSSNYKLQTSLLLNLSSCVHPSQGSDENQVSKAPLGTELRAENLISYGNHTRYQSHILHVSARHVFSKTKPKRNATTAFPSGSLIGDPSWWHCQVRPSPPMPVWGNECHQSLMLKKLGVGSIFNNSLTQRKLPFLCLQMRALILFTLDGRCRGRGIWISTELTVTELMQGGPGAGPLGEWDPPLLSRAHSRQETIQHAWDSAAMQLFCFVLSHRMMVITIVKRK